MSTTQTSSNGASGAPHRHGFAMRLEVVVLGVSDVDRAKAFYTDLGWRVDGDVGADGYRLVQLTPPGSTASIIFGDGVTAAAPGAGGDVLLAVDDIDAAREELIRHGVDVTEPFHDAGGSLAGGFFASPEHEEAGPDPEGRSYATYARFSDPDGNTWLLQEIGERLPGRVDPVDYTSLAAAADDTGGRG
jgi:catechol 2,3-dioxygenase-like lactoylglutathione lyase family enzyme